jgi:hypothetical protein
MPYRASIKRFILAFDQYFLIYNEMKTLRTLAFALVTVIVISGCDKVDEPIAQFNSSASNQKVLLEKFTGFRCTNCPQANDIAQNLKSVFGDQLIVVGVHCTLQFAYPTGATPDDPYHNDYRTTAGEAYHSAFNQPGLPSVLVNRKIVEGTAVIAPSESAAIIQQILSTPAPALVEFESVNYNESNRQVSFTVKMSTIENLDPGSYFMTAYLVEDSIYDWQLNAGVNVENYLHRNVLRDNINGTWGELAFSNGAANQDKTLNYQYTLNENWNADNCEIIAYLYREETREIVQVEKVYVKNP